MRALELLSYAPSPLQAMRLNRRAPPLTSADGRGSLLIRLLASSLNPIDLRLSEGYGHALLHPLRLQQQQRRGAAAVLGRDGVGQVVGVDDAHGGAWRFNVGDYVMFAKNPVNDHGLGTHADYTLVDENDSVCRVPAALSVAAAASIPFVSLAAFECLKHIEPHSKVLVQAAHSPLGVFTVQYLSRVLECEVVGVVSGRAAADGSDGRLTSEFGATDVFDASNDKVYSRIEEVHDSRSFDASIATLPRAIDDGCFEQWSAHRLLRSGGLLQTLASPLIQCYDEHRKYSLLSGTVHAWRTYWQASEELRSGNDVDEAGGDVCYRWRFARPFQSEALEHIATLYANGTLKAYVANDESMIDFIDIVDGYEQLKAGGVRGKLVVKH